jgi:hypothetical protein
MAIAPCAYSSRQIQPRRLAGACVALVLLSPWAASAQDARPESSAGFEMAVPEGWHAMTRHDVVDNIQKLSFTPGRLQALLAQYSRAVLLVAYQKYRTNEHRGLIPKVQVDVGRHTATTFEQFRSQIEHSTEELKKMLDGFTLTEPPQVVQVGGRQAVRIKAAFQVSAERVGTLTARARVYAVPHGDTFFQLNFTDGPDDDCSALFDALIESIRFE